MKAVSRLLPIIFISALFISASTSVSTSSGDYDPWADLDDDGDIDIHAWRVEAMFSELPSKFAQGIPCNSISRGPLYVARERLAQSCLVFFNLLLVCIS